MKRSISSLLGVALSLVILAPAAKAETEANPFNVATLAYQGHLLENGIPSYEALASGVLSGRITAEDVIEAAIASGHVDTATLEDGDFITEVARQLDNLVNVR